MYSFTAVSNEAVTILMIRIGAAANVPYFEFSATNGTLLPSLHDALPIFAFLDGFQLTQTGTYLIGCRAAGGFGTFTYNVTLVKTTGGNDSDEDESMIVKSQT